ncbi:MAG: hypothetical protein EXR73_01275 [Myxococcales bacterium]|nr:hypothetical protein [Myxococcales bacterium]
MFFYELPELFFQVRPAVAQEGDAVRGDVRGGPPLAPAGIYLAAIDSVPFEQFTALGDLDAFGAWVAGDAVPPGLSSVVYTLRAYATGFDGRLAESTDVQLTFE